MENKMPTTRREERVSSIVELIRGGLGAEELTTALRAYHDYDIALALDSLTEEERRYLLDIIGYEAAADVVSYMEDATEYLEEIEPSEIADIVEQMDADEAHGVLDALDDSLREQVLELIEDEEVKEDIELISSYTDDVFGSRMSTNYIAIKKGLTVKGAMSALISLAAENDNIHKIFVTEEDGTFYGAIDLTDLIVARSGDDLEALISTAFPYVLDTEDIDEYIDKVRAYSEDLIPVLSEIGHKLVGVIASSDIAELVDEAIGDDYAKLAALAEEEEIGESLFKSLKKRIPWLIILLFMGLVVSAVVGLFEGVISGLPLIVSFQSLILGMAGNVGTQSLAVTVRFLASSPAPTLSVSLKTIFKETKVAFLGGLAVGAISLLLVSAALLLGGNALSLAVSIGACVGLSMCFAMTVSGLVGALIPILLYRFGIDPAVASGPLITTVNDLVAVVSYYTLSWLLLFGLVF